MKIIMRSQMMKRIISFVLVLALTFSFCSIHVFAYDLKTDAEVNEGIELIERTMKLPRSYLEKSSVNQTGEIVYTYNISGVVFNVVATQESNGITFTITEGTNTNSLKFSNDNTLYLNNKSIGTVGGVNNSRAAYEIYWTEQCPYGSETDYSTQYRYVEKKYHNLETALIYLGAAMLAFALIQMEPALGVVGFDLMVSVAGIMIDDAPYATAASYKDTVYVHNVKGYWISASIDPLGVEKHSVELFAGQNFQYPVGGDPIVSFRCQDF